MASGDAAWTPWAWTLSALPVNEVKTFPEKRKIVKTIQVPGAGGTIDVKLIPGDRRGRAYTAGMIDDKLYLVDPHAGTAKAVFDFSTVAPGGWPQLIRMTADGTRMFVTMTGEATSSGYRYFSMLAVGDWAQRSFLAACSKRGVR